LFLNKQQVVRETCKLKLIKWLVKWQYYLIFIYFVLFNLLCAGRILDYKTTEIFWITAYLVLGICNFVLDIVFLVSIIIQFKQLRQEYLNSTSEKITKANKCIFKSISAIISFLLIINSAFHTIGRAVEFYHEDTLDKRQDLLSAYWF
jgi:hypothetical protein